MTRDIKEQTAMNELSEEIDRLRRLCNLARECGFDLQQCLAKGAVQMASKTMSIEFGADVRGETLRVRAWAVDGVVIVDAFKDYCRTVETSEIAADIMYWFRNAPSRNEATGDWVPDLPQRKRR